jgi:glycosyltransferase involved in cell wall biosynthesis
LKNILILHGSNDLYGASKVLLNVVDCLNANQYKVHVILPFKGNLDNKLIDIVHKLSYFKLGVFRKKYLNFFGLINRSYNILKSTIQIIKYIKNNEIDIVYSNTSVIWSGILASYISNRKSVVHIHEIPYGNNLYNIVSGFFFKYFVDSIIVVSKKVRDHWGKYYDFNKIKIIYNYSEFENEYSQKSGKKKSEYIISNISRIVPQKGIEYFIEISKEMLRLDNKFKFNIIGDTLTNSNNYLEKLKKIIKNYNLENKIFFKGFKRNIKVQILESDLILQTPVFPDSLPTVLIDSLSLNKPVVSTDLGGCAEILNYGKNGILIPTKNASVCAQIINQYSSDKNLQEKHLKNAKIFLNQNFSKIEFNKRVLDELNRVSNG